MSQKTARLGDVVSLVQTGPFGSQLHCSDYAEHGTPVIMPVNLVKHRISSENIARVEDIHVQRLCRHKVRKGDILYSRRGDVGRSAYVTQNEEGWLCGTGCLLVRPDPNIIRPLYLSYMLDEAETVEWVKNHAIGSTMPNLNTSILENIPVRFPDINQQEKVERMVSAYDTLIENNRKQIKLLEEAARRLYKEWFVDLRFPGHEHTPIVNGIPEGWRKTNIASVCTRIQSGGTPSRKNKSCWQGGNIRWFKTKELADTWLFDSEEFISEDALSSSAAKLFPKGTILMAIYASPTLGRLGILSKPAACNQAALGLIPDKTKCSCEWLFMQLYFLRDEFNAVAAGAGQQNISAKIVKEKTIILPHYEHLMEYTRLAEPMFENMRILTLSNLHLTEARDRLLPKLMSGEIAIK